MKCVSVTIQANDKKEAINKFEENIHVSSGGEDEIQWESVLINGDEMEEYEN